MSQYNGTLNEHELEQLWVAAGGPPSDEHLAAAIAEAESGGNTHATNHNTDGSTDLGPWQINNKAHPQYNEQQLLGDPLYDAKAAVAISNEGSDFGPWVTFKTGAYRKFLGGSSPNANTAPTGSPAPATQANTATSNSNPFLPTPKEPRGTGTALKDLGYVLLFAIGAGLLYIGITRTFRTPAGGAS